MLALSLDVYQVMLAVKEALIKASFEVFTFHRLGMRPQRREIAARNSGSLASSGSIKVAGRLF